jgi:hypothetical protein
MRAPLLSCLALFAVLTGLAVAQSPSDPDARTIVERAFAAASGDAWRYPGTIWLKGKYLDFKAGFVLDAHEPYELYRVQPRDHPSGNVADGKIRVSSYRDGKATMHIAFDGTKTYDIDGPTGDGADSPFWRLTMGFGMIRFALDPGYTLTRLPGPRLDRGALVRRGFGRLHHAIDEQA